MPDFKEGEAFVHWLFRTQAGFSLALVGESAILYKFLSELVISKKIEEHP
jgi:hypothetical protein